MGCWQQHLQIVHAIVKSNGWSEGMAALHLFAHLDECGFTNAECGFTNAEGRTGEMGRHIKRSFGILQLSRETSCVPAAIRECDSPTGSRSGYVRHRAGNPRSAGICGHGQACP